MISTSKPIKDVALAYGVRAETLRNWLIKHREANGGAETELTVSERARLKELERENQELKAETAFLKKATSDSNGQRNTMIDCGGVAWQALTSRVHHFFEDSEGTYGYRRIHADLPGESTECSPELVRQIMRDEGLIACQPRPFRVTTTADAAAAASMPDLVKRDFTADRPGVNFVGDISCSAQSKIM